MSRRKYYFSQKPSGALERDEMSSFLGGSAGLLESGGFCPQPRGFVIFL
jgi:hypothetical protein